MPNKQDILTAIKNLDVFLKLPELQGATARLNKNGSPFVYTGGFNMVFQLTHLAKKWAFRVWHVPMGEHKDRFLKISKYLTSKNLQYFADFVYDEHSLLVNGELVDTIRMEWLDGVLFKEYIEKQLSEPSKLINLADNFLYMCQDLRKHQISHGDLQEGNILVHGDGEIRLVDYDSICIPEIEGQQEFVTGLKGYQHPSRLNGGRASLKADYFSELIIYISLLSLAEKPDLWGKYQVKDTQYLLFTETDFEDFEKSGIYQDLKNLSMQIDRLLEILKEYLSITNYTYLKPFNSYLEPPKIVEFKSDKDILIQGGEICVFWEVENALQVSINNNIGVVESKGELRITPQDSNEYLLTAKGFNEDLSQTLKIKVFPTPIIKSLQVTTPTFENTTVLEINSPEFPSIQLGINNFSNSLNINFDNSIYSNVEGIEFKKLESSFSSVEMKNSGLNRIFNAITNNRIISKIFNNQSNEQN
ncbi:protein kinase domain-containing protein [Mangrovimonas xylaniphaga]|uniref:protein kinase domain-containing protein n=1 Tax=Mangrovimonas xylaniphaga TaxID=1645915 RepID=UPI0006B4C8EB|nr:hypothetical protein [Mangrovimonas xylaniphaga]